MYAATYLTGSTFAGNRTFSDDIVGKILNEKWLSFLTFSKLCMVFRLQRSNWVHRFLTVTLASSVTLLLLLLPSTSFQLSVTRVSVNDMLFLKPLGPRLHQRAGFRSLRSPYRNDRAVHALFSTSQSDTAKWSTTNVRNTFVEYFKAKHNHVNQVSSPVVPLLDPTLLFANAGMNQFKPIFLGQVSLHIVWQGGRVAGCIRVYGCSSHCSPFL